ncbi:MAG: hypothetical protein H0X02_08060, partial [Nitrosomonas sp.]|nr:hypothetical protein [Nitrosomonas sp.]
MQASSFVCPPSSKPAAYPATSADETLPPPTDELLEKYRVKFAVMINSIAGGCLVTPYYGNLYQLTHSEVLNLTSMVKLLFKRVQEEKVSHEQNLILCQKLTSTTGKVSKLIARVSDLQGEVDSLQQLKAKHSEALSLLKVSFDAGKALEAENQRLREEIKA